MLLKPLIIVLFIFIVMSLFQAVKIMNNPDSNKSMSQFFGRRLFASVIIFTLILAAIAFGVITPNPRPY